MTEVQVHFALGATPGQPVRELTQRYLAEADEAPRALLGRSLNALFGREVSA